MLCWKRALAERRFFKEMFFPDSQLKLMEARARMYLFVSGVGSDPSQSFLCCDTRLFLATPRLCGQECIFPRLLPPASPLQNHKHITSLPKAFNSQGHFGRPVTCWLLPNGPDSVRALETLGCRESATPRPGGRKRTVEEATRPDHGPAEPSKETSDFSAKGFLAKAF